MTILFKIYLWSCVGSALHCFFMSFSLGDPDMRRNADEFNKGYWRYKILLIFLPIVNVFFSLLFFLYIIALSAYFTNMARSNFAAWGTKKLMGAGRFFRIREFIVRKIFTRYLDCFYKSFDNDPVNKMIVRMFKNLKKNEKAKHQSKHHSEP